MSPPLLTCSSSSTHSVPQVRVGSAKAGFFAIASTPSSTAASGTVELLIKTPAPATAEAVAAAVAGGTPILITAAEVLTQLLAGDALEVSASQGQGFPVDRIPVAEFPTVLIFATGALEMKIPTNPCVIVLATSRESNRPACKR